METLELNGKRYIKASSAARETGYTMDYIGQLCRKKKIDAQLVGRTWYVLADEIHAHRRSRGRSVPSKVRAAVKEKVTADHKLAVPIVPEYRKRLITTTALYHRDEAELLPALQPRHLNVTSHERETTIDTNAHTSVKVVSESSAHSLAPVHEKKQEVKWNGTIVVAPLEDTTVKEEEVEEKHLQPTSEDRAATIEISTTTEEPAPREDAEVAREVPVNAPQPPTFVDRLNHAHVLNSETASLDQGADAPVVAEKAVTSTQRTPYFSLTVVAVGVVLALSNVAIERVIHVDQERRAGEERYIMTSRYDLVELRRVHDDAASAISAIRDMAYTKYLFTIQGE